MLAVPRNGRMWHTYTYDKNTQNTLATAYQYQKNNFATNTQNTKATQLKITILINLIFYTVEGLKVVEIERCKNDLKKLRDEMTSRAGGR